MALRRRDVIIATIIVFISWGFVTHWVPTLRYLPYAFIAGAASTVAILGWLIISTSRGKKYQEISGEGYGARHVAFVTPETWRMETEALKRRSQYKREPLYPASFVISNNLDLLIDLILRDFVSSWYGNISSRPTFANEVDRAVRAALSDIRDRVLAVDMVEIVVSRMVPLITSHMRDFYEAERVVRGKRLTRSFTESEELDLAIAGKYNDGKLHPAASLAYSNTKLVQQQHLRGIVTRLIPKVLPRSMTTSPAVIALIKEIVACAVLFPVMQMLSDPDTWNQLMEAYGRTMLQDRKTVRKLRAALDEHAPPSPKSPRNAPFPKLSPNDNERKFERFIRAIRQTNTLSDARRFRSEVASQLRRESAVEGQDPVYIRRLETGKRILDQRVATLGAGGSVKQKLSVQLPQAHKRTASKFENASLREVLYDASGLSCFMEYMDRLNLMRLVQFWIVVDGFRNPLERDTDEPEEYLGALPAWTESDRADLGQINDAYLSKPELKILPQARQAVTDFLKAGKAATPMQYHAARRAILQAQTAAYEELQEPHFRRFKKSDLYFKWLAMDEATGVTSSPTTSKNGSQDKSKPSSLIASSKVTRAQSARHILQSPDLRRAVVSSSDLKGYIKPAEGEDPARRSLDGTSRTPLFDDDYDSDPLARSTQSLDSDIESSRANANDAKVVDAMQAALNNIMEDEPDKNSLFSEPSITSPQDNDSMKSSLELPRPASPMPPIQKKGNAKPSIASLGLVGEPSRLGVFTDDDLFGEEEKFLEDEVEDSDVNEKIEEDEIHEAAPGDLGLAEAIDALSSDIERLVTQESIVDSLTTKAELTNNAAELRILRKSKASLKREIQGKELQRQQYIVQESDNSLYGRATVFIQSIIVGNEEDGREYAMYVIEVRRRAGDQMPAATWVVTRRYSEFHELNKRLRAKYPEVRNLEFPRRQMVLKLQKDFLQKRRLGLERYLRELLLIPAICRSRELRAFLSQQAISDSDLSSSQSDSRDFVTRIYNSVTDGMEEFLGNIPVLDQLSVAGQNLISAATSQLASNGVAAPIIPTSTILSTDPTTDAEAEAELRAFENRELEPFVKPICDLFLEAFELNRESNWLRGRAVVVVLHQLLGGTIERKVREHAKLFLSEENVVKYLELIKKTMWPGGKMKEATVRGPAEKVRSRKEAGLVLATLVPDLAGSVVGRANAQAASRRILATVNNQRLNTHLAFTLLDEFVQVIFPDATVR